MKKTIALFLAIIMLLSFSACASSQPKDYGEMVSADIGSFSAFADGADITDGKATFADFKDKFSVVQIKDKYYYAAAVKDLSTYDLTDIKAFFAEAADGYVAYHEGLEDVYAAVLESEDGKKFSQISFDGKPAYSLILPEGKTVGGFEKIYMLTKTADFSVAIKENGKEAGRLTIDEFMRKTSVDGENVATSMYDGSFMYKLGKATYEGRFLGIDYKTMLAKLADMGIAFSGEIKDVEFYGTPGKGEVGKNTQYKAFSDEKAYFGNIKFFCMYDGMINNPGIKDIDMGLSAFINGSGQKWITYNLTEINFITE